MSLTYLQRSLAADEPPRRSDARVLAWVLAGVAAAVLLSGVIGIVRSSQDAHDAAAARLRAVAALKASMVSDWISDRRADGHAVMGDAALMQLNQQWRQTGDEASRRQLATHLRAILFASNFTEAWLFDEDGRPLMSVPQGAAAPPPLTSLVQQALQREEVLETGLHDGGRGGAVAFDLLVPLRGEVSIQRSVLVLRADPAQRLLPLVHAWPGAERGAGIVLFRNDGENVITVESGPSGAVLTRTASSGQGVVAARSHEQQPGLALETEGWSSATSFAVSMPVRGTPWMVLVQLPAAKLHSTVRRDAAWIALVDILVLAAAAGVLFVVWQRRELQGAQREKSQQAEKLRALQLLDAIAHGSTDCIWAKDRSGRYVMVNDESCRLLGRTREEILGTDDLMLFPHEQAVIIGEVHREILSTARRVSREITVDVKDGTRIFQSVMGPLVDSSGAVTGVFGVSRDVTEQRREEDTRRQWAMAFESTRDGVMITDACSRIQTVNRAFTEITGYAPDDVVGRTPAVLQSGRHDAAFYAGMWRQVSEWGHWQGEIWNRRRDGEVYPEWLTLSAVQDPAGRVTNYVGVFTDITGVKRSEAELERLAHYDPLTDLPNRRLLQQRLDHALARAGRTGGRCAVLYIDLDGFKTVNDSLGHPAGDALLECVAKRLQARLRGGDTLGRLGGDEFLIVMETIATPTDASVLARDVLQAIAQPVQLPGGADAYVTASIGISVHPDDGTTTSVEMLRDADAAMYRAKDKGRNGFCFYTSDLNAEAVAKLELEAALSRALERNELVLHYQPKVDSFTGRMLGVEALLRWNRGGARLVPPGQFIPVAEGSSLILDIGAWVIDSACRQVRQWMDEGLAAPRVAVNVAARQFAAGRLDELLAKAMARHGVPPACIEVELTESMLMQHPGQATALLHRIKALGVVLSLDDFGTGYSSLGYLRQFPIDALKIDKSFVQSIGQGEDGSAIVDAVISLAHRLHLRVVAEGVETVAQRDYLVDKRCDEMQGYCFSPPVTAAEISARLAAQQAPTPT